MSGFPALAAVMVFAVATGITGCVWSSAGQPVPYVICGTTLNAVGNGGVDQLQNGLVTEPTGNQGRFIFIVTYDCVHGSHVTWVPSSAAHLDQAAYAQDGQMVAVVLKPSGPHAVFRVTATRNGRVVASTTVEPAS